jgi:hypothetical protein
MYCLVNGTCRVREQVVQKSRKKAAYVIDRIMLPTKNETKTMFITRSQKSEGQIKRI